MIAPKAPRNLFCSSAMIPDLDFELQIAGIEEDRSYLKGREKSSLTEPKGPLLLCSNLSRSVNFWLSLYLE
jgi:hypothetical protein